MIDVRDMFQWDRYITPLIAPLFFWVATLVALMAGVFGLTSGVLLITNYPLVAILIVVASILIACLGVLAAGCLPSSFWSLFVPVTTYMRYGFSPNPLRNLTHIEKRARNPFRMQRERAFGAKLNLKQQ